MTHQREQTAVIVDELVYYWASNLNRGMTRIDNEFLND